MVSILYYGLRKESVSRVTIRDEIARIKQEIVLHTVHMDTSQWRQKIFIERSDQKSSIGEGLHGKSRKYGLRTSRVSLLMTRRVSYIDLRISHSIAHRHANLMILLSEISKTGSGERDSD